MNPSRQLSRFDYMGSSAWEYDAQLGAFAANVGAIVDALAAAGRRLGALVSRPLTSVAGTAR